MRDFIGWKNKKINDCTVQVQYNRNLRRQIDENEEVGIVLISKIPYEALPPPATTGRTHHNVVGSVDSYYTSLRVVAGGW